MIENHVETALLFIFIYEFFLKNNIKIKRHQQQHLSGGSLFTFNIIKSVMKSCNVNGKSYTHRRATPAMYCIKFTSNKHSNDCIKPFL